MAIHDVTEDISLVIGRVADAIVIAISAGIIAPIIAAPIFGEAVGGVAALLGFEWRLPNLGGIANESVSDKNVLFGEITHVEADVVGRNDISFETVLVGLLHKEAAILAIKNVVSDPGIVDLLQDHAMSAVGDHEVTFHDQLAAEHESCADDIVGERIAQELVLVRIHVVNAEPGFRNSIGGKQRIVRIREIEPITFVMKRVSNDPVARGIPKMHAIATSGGGNALRSTNFVVFDGAVTGAAQKHAKRIILDAAIMNAASGRRDHNPRVKGGEVVARVAQKQPAYFNVRSGDDYRRSGTIRIDNGRVSSQQMERIRKDDVFVEHRWALHQNRVPVFRLSHCAGN